MGISGNIKSLRQEKARDVLQLEHGMQKRREADKMRPVGQQKPIRESSVGHRKELAFSLKVMEGLCSRKVTVMDLIVSPKIDILESYFPISHNVTSFGDRIFTEGVNKLK